MNEADTDDAREGDGLDLAAAGAMPPLMLCSGTVSFSPPARCETSAPRGTPRAAGGARYRAHNSAGFDRPAAHSGASRLRTLGSEVFRLEAGFPHQPRPAHLARQDAHPSRNPSNSNRAPRAVPEPAPPPADADHFAA